MVVLYALTAVFIVILLCGMFTYGRTIEPPPKRN